jgi:hypothetical protein
MVSIFGRTTGPLRLALLGTFQTLSKIDDWEPAHEVVRPVLRAHRQ